jgi:steroid delta-isomerase-like uncharacterized protein
MSERNKLIVRRLLEEAAGSGDLALVDDLVASDFVGHASSPDQEGHGIEGYKAFITSLRQAFPDLQITVEDQVAEGDRVVSRWRARGTHQGEYFGVPASGRQGEMTGINIDRVVGGKTVECWGEQDGLGIMQQLGAIPTPNRTS